MIALGGGGAVVICAKLDRLANGNYVKLGRNGKIGAVIVSVVIAVIGAIALIRAVILLGVVILLGAIALGVVTLAAEHRVLDFVYLVEDAVELLAGAKREG
jgi:hypothetical protein